MGGANRENGYAVYPNHQAAFQTATIPKTRRYDGEDNLSRITYPDGTKVTYAYDKNGNMNRVTDRHGKATSYEYDALNWVTEMHRPNGIATYNTYNARNQITELTNSVNTAAGY